MRVTRKKQNGYFDIPMLQFSLGYIKFQGGLLYWLVSVISIVLATMMIESLLQVMFLVLVPHLSLGIVRNNRLFLFL
jgi:hypothetical protein